MICLVPVLHPRPWRERWGDEFAVLLEDAQALVLVATVDRLVVSIETPSEDRYQRPDKLDTGGFERCS